MREYAFQKSARPGRRRGPSSPRGEMPEGEGRQRSLPVTHQLVIDFEFLQEPAHSPVRMTQALGN